ncbi:MAG: CPBP family intramembrane metalloprotease [Oscillospiraceae bacterium]|nr:CPBP family intramembrane metalloprotease [Oscillospiraceae bacterium]
MADKTASPAKKQAAAMMAIVLAGVVAMTVIDLIIQPPYAVKSAAKVVLFTGMPLVYSLLVNKELDLKTMFRVGGGARGIIEAVLFGAAVFGVIVGAYLLIGGLFDFSQITANMEKSMGITKDNFLFVALYISFVNSFLEEFFFRGFACLKLQQYVSRRAAYAFSSISFSAYHIAMMWVAFEPPLVAFACFGLIIGGCLFNFFNEKYGNLYISWLIHMGANFAINGIAMSLYGII